MIRDWWIFGPPAALALGIGLVFCGWLTFWRKVEGAPIPWWAAALGIVCVLSGVTILSWGVRHFDPVLSENAPASLRAYGASAPCYGRTDDRASWRWRVSK